MPIVRVEMLTGRSQAQKTELAKVLSEETARIANCPVEHVQLIIDEYERASWAVGGVLQPSSKPDAR
jgi:4-oxalocrotonate tautomerase